MLRTAGAREHQVADGRSGKAFDEQIGVDIEQHAQIDDSLETTIEERDDRKTD